MYINARPPWCMHALGGTSGAIEATGTTLHTATACSPPLFQATIKAIYRSTNTLNMHCRGNSLTHTYIHGEREGEVVSDDIVFPLREWSNRSSGAKPNTE